MVWRWGALPFLVLGLYGCCGGGECGTKVVSEKDKHLADFSRYVESSRSRFPRGFSLDQLRAYMSEQNFQEASRYVNCALLTDRNNAVLHLINGFMYEELANRGDASRKDLVEIAYRSAYNLDPSQWYSAYLLGRHYLEEKKYADAQQALANALILRPGDHGVLYDLAFASYYVRDVPVAVASIRKALSIKPKDALTNRAGAVIFAAAGKSQKAKECLEVYANVVGKNHGDVRQVASRIEEWGRTHRDMVCRVAKKTTEASDQKGDGKPGGRPFELKSGAKKKKWSPSLTFESKPEDKKGAKPCQTVCQADDPCQEKKAVVKEDERPAIILDCYLLRLQQKAETNKGQNLFASFGKGIEMSFGNMNYNRTTKNLLPSRAPASGANTETRIFPFAVTAATLTYNMNIANAIEQVVEIIQRPTLSVMLKETSKLRAGDEYLGGIAGANASSLGKAVTGVSVTVTPKEVTKSGKVILDVGLEGILLTTPVVDYTTKGMDARTFDFARSDMHTVVKTKFDQTAMIGGMYERTQQNIKTGFPLLQDIPIVQYLFANEKTTAVIKTVIYVVTPRCPSKIAECTKDIEKCGLPREEIAKKLESEGVVAVNEYMSLHFILKGLLRKPTFFDFRSGDIVPVYWGKHCLPAGRKLDQLAAFLYF